MPFLENTANVVANAPLGRRILGSFLSAVVGWTALVIILLPLIQSQSVSLEPSFAVISVIAAVAGIFVFGTWIIALLPLYLLVPLGSILWRWPICTLGGAASGATIMFIFARMGSPQAADIFIPVIVASLVGGLTCLFASLTRFRFQRER